MVVITSPDTVDVANSSSAPDLDFQIWKAMQSLPPGTFYQGTKDKPVTLEQQARFAGNRTYIIEVPEESICEGERLGISLPKGALLQQVADDSIRFQHLSRTFEVRHPGIPVEREYRTEHLNPYS